MSERKYDPRRPYKVWLSCFDEYPAEERPTFTFRRTSADEWDQIADAIDGNADNTKALSDSVFATVAIGLMTWDKQVDPTTGDEVEFDAAKLRKVINTREAIELCELRLQGARVTHDEKKTSELPA